MMDLVGQTLGQYEIQARIGQGGMATVYQGWQTSMKRPVAVKVMSPDLLDDDEFIARFRQEAETIAKLEHPHIIPVIDFGHQDDYVYLVMRLVSSGTLEQELKNGPLSLQRANTIFRQIATALSYAHGKGIIHRDLKPANVLLDEQGNGYLTDFGIAKMIAGTTNLTRSGHLMGTPAYMAPEQWRSQPIDARTDVYALGIMLYEMLVGLQPFEADTPYALMYNHIDKMPPSPVRYHPALPTATEVVIFKAIAKPPHERYSSADEMAAALEQVVARAPNPNYQPARPKQRFPLIEKGQTTTYDDETTHELSLADAKASLTGRQSRPREKLEPTEPEMDLPSSQPTPPQSPTPARQPAASPPTPPSQPPPRRPAPLPPDEPPLDHDRPPAQRRRSRLPLILIILLLVIGAIIAAFVILSDSDEGDATEEAALTTTSAESTLPPTDTEASETETPAAIVIITTSTPTERPAGLATEEPTVEPTEEPTEEPTVEPTEEPTVEPTEEPTEPSLILIATNTPEPTATATDTPSVTDTPLPTDTPTNTPEPTVTDTQEPTATPTETPTETPSPTATDTLTPTLTPTETLTPTPEFTPTPNFAATTEALIFLKVTETAVAQADSGETLPIISPTPEDAALPLLPLASLTATETPGEDGVPTAICTVELYADETVNIRSGPGQGFDVVDEFTPGDIRPALMRTNTGWVYVFTGWISENTIFTTTTACGNLPVISAADSKSATICTIRAMLNPSDLQMDPAADAVRVAQLEAGTTLNVFRVITGSDGQRWYYAATNDANWYFGWMAESHAEELSVCPPSEE